MRTPSGEPTRGMAWGYDNLPKKYTLMGYIPEGGGGKIEAKVQSEMG